MTQREVFAALTQIPVTLLGLLVHAWTRDAHPILAANSLVGVAYMVLERDAIATRGGSVLGMRRTWTHAENVVVNVATHLIAPWMLVAAEGRPMRARASTVAMFVVACTLVVDLDSVYATSHVNAYYARYLVVLLGAVAVCAAADRIDW